MHTHMHINEIVGFMQEPCGNVQECDTNPAGNVHEAYGTHIEPNRNPSVIIYRIPTGIRIQE